MEPTISNSITYLKNKLIIFVTILISSGDFEKNSFYKNNKNIININVFLK